MIGLNWRKQLKNESGIYPVDFKVLVAQEKAEKVSAGGIVLVDETVEKEQWKVWQCTVVDIGPRAFSDHPSERIPKPGDSVIIREYAGYRIKGKDGEEYHIINDKDIMALGVV
jgi:co-chaperonin GroES (HSP10)